MRMQVVYCITDLIQLGTGMLLLELLILLDVLIQGPLLHVLHHYEEMGLVAEESVHLHHVWVVDERVYFELLDELLHY